MLVMFDLDNTLGDRAGAVRRWAVQFAEERQLPDGAVQWILDRDEDGYRDRTEVFEEVRHRFDLATPTRELVATYRTAVVELTAEVAGATDCLVKVRAQGHTVAIVTNGSSGQQHAKIDRLGFRPLVDAVIVSGDLAIKKPDRRIFEAAAEATASSLEDAWMVGDAARHDCVGAAALGLRTAWMRRGRTWPVELAPPTVILDELAQLPPLLR